jgi:hypothetical protein
MAYLKERGRPHGSGRARTPSRQSSTEYPLIRAAYHKRLSQTSHHPYQVSPFCHRCAQGKETLHSQTSLLILHLRWLVK